MTSYNTVSPTPRLFCRSRLPRAAVLGGLTVPELIPEVPVPDCPEVALEVSSSHLFQHNKLLRVLITNFLNLLLMIVYSMGLPESE